MWILGFEPKVHEIVSFGKTLGLEFDAGDVDELINEHVEEQVTEESQLHQKNQNM